MSIGDFVCCPSCGEQFNIVRVGRVGVYGRKDSPRFHCLSCDTRFKAAGGQTINEAMGSLK